MNTINLEIQTAIASIKNEHAHQNRIDEIAELLAKISKLNAAQIDLIDNKSLDEIADLLAADSETIRSYAARILGVMGGHAKREIPALKAADQLSSATPGKLLPSVGASADIRAAIKKIQSSD
jgi:hypothetical protein